MVRDPWRPRHAHHRHTPGKLFPHSVFAKWLQYGNGTMHKMMAPRVFVTPRATDSKLPQADASFFKRREFCFTMDGDVFVRYLAFKVSLPVMMPCLTHYQLPTRTAPRCSKQSSTAAPPKLISAQCTTSTHNVARPTKTLPRGLAPWSVSWSLISI